MDYKTYVSYVPSEDQFEEKELKMVPFMHLGNKKVTLIKKKVLDKDKINVVGYLNCNGKPYTKEEQEADLVTVNGSEFELLKKKCGSLMGYLPVDGKGNYVAVCHHNLFLILFLGGLLLALLAAGFFMFGNNKPAEEEPKAPIIVADGEDYDGNINNGELDKEDDARYIEIPGYTGIYVSPESYVDLVNPESNHVYFKYTVTEGEKTLYESDYIAPGKKIAWKASDYIKGAGQHDLIFEVSTVSVDTEAACNGATFNVTATVG